MKKASMISVGAYVPPHILTNADLEKIVETSDDWIVKRTGIKTRHIASISLLLISALSIATKAAL